MSQAPLWTALYTLRDGDFLASCWNVEIGHPDGPPFNRRVARKLARKYLKRNKEQLEGFKLERLNTGSREENGY